MLESLPPGLLIYILIFILLFNAVRAYWPLRHVPGPFLARWTDLWRLFVVWGRKAHTVQLQLHKKHGDVVRLGPNCVSVSAPEVTGSIYGIGKGLVKAGISCSA